jgi:uncharacterized protein YndB with AHSA1/START domain
MSDIVLDTVYPHPPERVWRALTDPKELNAWLMPNDFAPIVGRKFQFRVRPMWGWRGIVDCEVLEVDPPRKLSYTWQGDPKYRVTTVTWTLEPAASGGTLLRLEHTGFRGFGGMLLKWMLGSGWKKMFRTSLPAVLDGKAVGPHACR